MSLVNRVRRRSSVSFFNSEDEMLLAIEVQRRVMLIYDENPHLFDESDVKNIIALKRYTRNFLSRQKFDVNKTVEMITKALVWRKEHNLPRLTTLSFPRELLQLGAIFTHGRDMDNNRVVYVRCKFISYAKGLQEFIDRFMIAHYYSALEEGLLDNKGYTVVYDTTNMTTENMNIQESLQLLRAYHRFVPDGMRLLLIYNLPWFAKTPFQITLKLWPSELANLMKVVSGGGITNYITEDNLPNIIRNSSERYSVEIPPEAKSVDDIDLEAVGVRSEDKQLLVDHIQKLSKIK